MGSGRTSDGAVCDGCHPSAFETLNGAIPKNYLVSSVILQRHSAPRPRLISHSHPIGCYAPKHGGELQPDLDDITVSPGDRPPSVLLIRKSLVRAQVDLRYFLPLFITLPLFHPIGFGMSRRQYICS